jgi:hypothetical protein
MASALKLRFQTRDTNSDVHEVIARVQIILRVVSSLIKRKRISRVSVSGSCGLRATNSGLSGPASARNPALSSGFSRRGLPRGSCPRAASLAGEKITSIDNKEKQSVSAMRIRKEDRLAK